MRTGLRTTAVVGAMVLVLATAVPAMAVIVMGQRIGKVKVGQKLKVVNKEMGKPSSSACGPGSGGGTVCSYSWKKQKINVQFVNKLVVEIDTTSRKQKTSSGVGVGSTRTAVNKAFPACAKAGASTECILGKTAHNGDKYMVFAFDGATTASKVTFVQVGKWDDRDPCVLGCG
jgi:hypothetical protein